MESNDRRWNRGMEWNHCRSVVELLTRWLSLARRLDEKAREREKETCSQTVMSGGTACCSVLAAAAAAVTAAVVRQMQGTHLVLLV